MLDTDHLEIGTLSFARCDGEMIIGADERVRLILCAVEAYAPDLLVTGGHALHTLRQLSDLAREHAELETTTTIVTEVLHDGEESSDTEDNAMYAILGTGEVHAFGRQVFGQSAQVKRVGAPALAAFDDALPARSLAVPDWNLFALNCGEINVLSGRHAPRFLSAGAEEAIMAADVVTNPTHDRMGHHGTLAAKRRALSRGSEDGRNRVYVSCSNWEACGGDQRRLQHPSATLHTVYAAGEPTCGEELADGAFGFVYRRWALDL